MEWPEVLTATPHGRNAWEIIGHGRDQFPGSSYVFIFKNKIRKAYSMLFYPQANAYMIQYDI